LIDAVVVLEGVEGANARQLSVRMTQGKRWSILGAVVLTVVGLIVVSVLLSFILYLPLSLVGQEENFAIALIYECINNILFALLNIVLFLFYWDAKNW
jgi:multisubunit Na+/H+ antiporter MnhB subunit